MSMFQVLGRGVDRGGIAFGEIVQGLLIFGVFIAGYSAKAMRYLEQALELNTFSLHHRGTLIILTN